MARHESRAAAGPPAMVGGPDTVLAVAESSVAGSSVAGSSAAGSSAAGSSAVESSVAGSSAAGSSALAPLRRRAFSLAVAWCAGQRDRDLDAEEQFYLLWPFALLWGYRRNPRLFAALTVSFIEITLALDLYLGLSREVKYDPHQYFGTDTNALPILVGSLLAIVVHNDWLSRTVRYLAPCALPAVALLPVLAYRNDTYRCSLVIVAGTGLTLVMLIGVVTRPRSAVGSLLASGPMRWLGERSYSIYLWNVLARIAILYTLGHTAVGDIAWIAMFVVPAEASFRFVERPLRAKLARRSSVSGPPNCGPVGVRVPRAL